jgi:hypothetical protein
MCTEAVNDVDDMCKQFVNCPQPFISHQIT